MSKPIEYFVRLITVIVAICLYTIYIVEEQPLIDFMYSYWKVCAACVSLNIFFMALDYMKRRPEGTDDNDAVRSDEGRACSTH